MAAFSAITCRGPLSLRSEICTESLARSPSQTDEGHRNYVASFSSSGTFQIRQFSSDAGGGSACASRIISSSILLGSSRRGSSSRHGLYKFQASFADDAKRKTTEAAKEASKKAQQILRDAKEGVEGFATDMDLEGKAKWAFTTANQKYEELEFDIRRQISNLDRQYSISERAREAASAASEKLQGIDDQLRVRQRLRTAASDFQRAWPRYQREISALRATPIGQAIGLMLFSWLLLSGWLFQIMFWSIWILPLLPFILSAIARSTLVSGFCPACGLQFIGRRSETVICQRCRRIVWQGKGGNDGRGGDPKIIDIELD
eukprot:TRINITY_DN2317_c1_g1_i1.p1 TRINITY_DN2317_c1_g1~~TRINITY_DN2317_c1_g1_i1.p1  ORF type:complete len:327 (-),score=49.17 TRINITY_DN2317_c1_g1_i1:52-1005(-)